MPIMHSSTRCGGWFMRRGRHRLDQMKVRSRNELHQSSCAVDVMHI